MVFGVDGNCIVVKESVPEMSCWDGFEESNLGILKRIFPPSNLPIERGAPDREFSGNKPGAPDPPGLAFTIWAGSLWRARL